MSSSEMKRISTFPEIYQGKVSMKLIRKPVRSAEVHSWER